MTQYKITTIILLIIILTGCVKIAGTGGYVTEFSSFNKVVKGTSTKQTVRKLLGSPSVKSTFGEKKWYYIGLKTETEALKTPEITEQTIYIITFNEKGIVKNVEKQTGENRRAITISEESTPTEGNELGIMEQLLGNLGRFNEQE